MAQDRMLRAELRMSEKVNEWPIPLRFFWTQLWGYCDDWGRGRYDARLIKADAFPLDDEVTATVVGRWMRALEEAGVIAPYEVASKRYFECVNWDEHQDVPYRKKTTVPDRSGVIPTAGKSSGKVQKDPEKSGPSKGEVEGEVEVEGESAAGAPPSEFCSKHPGGTTSKCGACGDARRARKSHDIALATKPTPRATKFGQCPAVIAKGSHRYVGGYCAECSQREAEAA